jgi:ketosteroid isomerase-like protein
MTEQENVQRIQELYAAFGRGDVPAVVVLGSLHGCVKDTGRSYDNEWAMVWTLRDGKVAGWQIYEDTARELAADTA